MFNCYDNVIGLSESPCECLPEAPTGSTTSKSGLFMDELTPINNLLLNKPCANGVWDILTSARNKAIKSFISDSSALLYKKYALKYNPLKNQILGQIKALKTINSSKQYSVLRIACKPIKNGFLKIKSINTLFESTGTIEVSIFDNVTGLLATTIVNTEANTLSLNSYIRTLPTKSKYVDILEYYFVFVFDQANKPKETKLSCGCGGVSIPTFDIDQPYFNSIKRGFQWSKYLMVGSMQIDNLADLEDISKYATANTSGLILEIDLGCDVTKTLCDGELDFQTDGLAMAMAMAIRFSAGISVADSVLKNGALNRSNLIDRDLWLESIVEWEIKYEQHLNFIVNNVNLDSSGCFTCKPNLRSARQGLLI